VKLPPRTAVLSAVDSLAGSVRGCGPHVYYKGVACERHSRRSGLGSLPFEHAETVPACFPEEVATGNDFGSTVWFEDTTQGWRAGEGTGDCIGLIFKTFTETEVVFHFGSAYSHYIPLANGDSYTVTVYSLTHSGAVKLKK